MDIGKKRRKKGALSSFCQGKLSVSSLSLLFKSFTIAKLVLGMSFFLLKQNHVGFISNTNSANVGFSQYLLPLCYHCGYESFPMPSF